MAPDLPSVLGAERIHTAVSGRFAFADGAAADVYVVDADGARVPEDAIPRMAEAAMKVTRLLKNNLRQLTAGDAEAIYRAAY